jgi:hypothetical protein
MTETPFLLTAGQKIVLAASLLPYLVLALYDGWLHEKARRVPRIEQGLHGALFLAGVAFVAGVFTGRMLLAVPALAMFAVAAVADEWGFHGALALRERKLHHFAYACFAGFVAVAVALGALRWP